MSTFATALTSWEEFLLGPDAPDGEHYELRDGEVCLVPPARAIHKYLQIWLLHWLTDAAKGLGKGSEEFPYRPAKNLQFWYADVAYIPNEDLRAMRVEGYSVYSPPLVIEILSPSNGPEEINRRRVAAFSCETREFWLIDADARTIEVSVPGCTSRVYRAGDHVPVSVIPDAVLSLNDLFD